MKRLTHFLSPLTLIAGLVGSVLLRSHRSTVNDRGLLEPGHPATAVILVLAGILVAIAIVVSFLSKTRNYRILLPFPVQAIGCAVGAVGFLLHLILEEPSVLMIVISIVAALSLFALAACFWLQKRPPLYLFAPLCIALLALCFNQYQVWGTYTQLQLYLFPAAATLLLAIYAIGYLRIHTWQKPGRSHYVIHQLTLFACLVCTGTSLWPYYLAMAVWLAGGLFVQSYKMRLPGDVEKCIRKLEKEGYSAYAVGGCVRDAMLGLIPHDYDLCTSATPEQICKVFSKYQLIRNGEKHGTIGVVMGKTVYEITTYRTEGAYEDNRHPDQVEFVEDLSLDLARRDFTINAMAFHPKTGYVDPFGGEHDLHDGILRAVGNPTERFQEDALRILRLVRFACRFRMDVESKTWKAMKKQVQLLDNLAKERVFSEMDQILCHLQPDDLKRFKPVFLQVIPELSQCVDFDQHSRHHAYDVFTHTDRVVAAVDPDPVLRWAALLHDVGKPQVFTRDEAGHGHFLGHAKVSAQMAEDILRRLKASNQLREQVVFLILHHMDVISTDKKAMHKLLNKYSYETVKQMITFQFADRLGKGKGVGKYEIEYDRLCKLAAKTEKECDRLQLRDLAVDGHDLMDALGFTPGPLLGQCQKMLYEAVLDGKVANDKTELLHLAQEFLQQHKEETE